MFEMDSKKTCCGCFSLQAGCFIIGGIEIILWIVSIAAMNQVTGILFVILPLLLIVGAQTKNRHFMWPWIIWNGLVAAIAILLAIVFAIGFVYCSFEKCQGFGGIFNGPLKEIAIQAILFLFGIAICIYRVYIVRSYMEALLAAENSRSRLRNTF